MNNIIIINPLISARFISDELKKSNFNTIAIFTLKKEKLDSYFIPDSDLFNQQIYLDTSETESIISVIKKFKPCFIINGSESTTHTTDCVTASVLPRYSNDPATSHFRSNKYYMKDRLKQNGLPYIKQQIVNNRDLSQLDLDSVEFPCFCKPVSGICTIGAFKANTRDELIPKLNAISGIKSNLSDSPDYLIQQYIDGEEYYIDTFSYLGQHFVSSVGHYTKEFINYTPVYRSFELVKSNVIWKESVNFVKQCLDATELKNGFAHTEIFITKDGAFYLIEINARISGLKGYINRLAQSVNLKSQIDLLADCLNHGYAKESTLENKVGYVKGLVLFNFFDHPLKDPSKILQTIPSICSYQLLKPVGYTGLPNNKTLVDVDLIVLLYNKDKDQLKNDAIKLYSLEQSGELL